MCRPTYFKICVLPFYEWTDSCHRMFNMNVFLVLSFFDYFIFSISDVRDGSIGCIWQVEHSCVCQRRKWLKVKCIFYLVPKHKGNYISKFSLKNVSMLPVRIKICIFHTVNCLFFRTNTKTSVVSLERVELKIQLFYFNCALAAYLYMKIMGPNSFFFLYRKYFNVNVHLWTPLKTISWRKKPYERNIESIGLRWPVPWKKFSTISRIFLPSVMLICINASAHSVEHGMVVNSSIYNEYFCF